MIGITDTLYQIDLERDNNLKSRALMSVASSTGLWHQKVGCCRDSAWQTQGATTGCYLVYAYSRVFRLRFPGTHSANTAYLSLIPINYLVKHPQQDNFSLGARKTSATTTILE